MDRKRAWVIPAFCGALILVVAFHTLGGLAGIAKNPQVSIIVIAIMLVTLAPSLWLTYLKNRREPILVEVDKNKSSLVPEDKFKKFPIIIHASTWKIFTYIVFSLVFGGLFLGIDFFQPGVCRVISIAAYAPLWIWSVAVWLACLFVPPQLTLGPDGLTYSTFGVVRHWPWDEIRDITLVKRQLPFIGWFLKRRPTASLYFKRFQPANRATGPARAGFSSIWKIAGDELAVLLEAARERWSTPAGSAFVPVPRTYRLYIRTTLTMVIVFGTIWMWYAHPCAH